MEPDYAVSAITSFVLSLVPFVLLVFMLFFGVQVSATILLFYLLSPLLAILFGIFAFFTIEKHDLYGMPMASVGVVLGILYVFLLQLLV